MLNIELEKSLSTVDGIGSPIFYQKTQVVIGDKFKYVELRL